MLLFPKYFILACIGGSLYMLTEIIWRGYSHWTMGAAGGICFLMLGWIHSRFSRSVPLYLQAISGAVLVTAIELLFGIICNIWLNLNIWDYGNLPFNLFGQICLPYALLWIPLSCAGIVLYRWISHLLFHEDKPRLRLI